MVVGLNCGAGDSTFKTDRQVDMAPDDDVGCRAKFLSAKVRKAKKLRQYAWNISQLLVLLGFWNAGQL